MLPMPVMLLPLLLAVQVAEVSAPRKRHATMVRVLAVELP